MLFLPVSPILVKTITDVRVKMRKVLCPIPQLSPGKVGVGIKWSWGAWVVLFRIEISVNVAD